MPTYKVVTRDSQMQILQTTSRDFTDDEDAISVARHLLESADNPIVEVWDDIGRIFLDARPEISQPINTSP